MSARNEPGHRTANFSTGNIPTTNIEVPHGVHGQTTPKSNRQVARFSSIGISSENRTALNGTKGYSAGQRPPMLNLQQVQQLLGLTSPDKHEVQGVTFICFDLEAHELDQRMITEIGVSVLDLRSTPGTTAGVEPGSDDHMDKLSNFQYAHYRIEEHMHLVNRRFVKGCPEDFMFGNTQVIPLGLAGLIPAMLFSNPTNLDSTQVIPLPTDAQSTGGVPTTNIVLVGHNLKSDIRYLKQIGFDPFRSGCVVALIDTQLLVSRKKQPVGLSRLMRALGLNYTHLHNAGNDAAYTMQSLILLAVQEKDKPGSVQEAIAASRATASRTKAALILGLANVGAVGERSHSMESDDVIIDEERSGPPAKPNSELRVQNK